MNDKIIIKGAKEHNLKNINLEIPRDKMVVITGLSGSGKSSLAFDTLYAEGQRRYVESLSSYARQFLGIMEKPDVETIEGLSPAISIDQKTTSKNPRSTVGTVTEIYDYIRLLYANIGVPYCPNCGKKIEKQSIDQIVDNIMELEEGYDTDCGQRGVKLSGGQKQRLCIARALLKHPKILILDDSTSAVDTATEASIKEALASLKGTTKIIIAQRISSLQHANQIIILDNGKIHAI